MKLKLLIILGISLLLSNCKEKTQQKDSVETKTIENNGDAISSLILNNGEKWIANKETHEGFMKMDSMITAFKSEQNRNFAALADSLSLQTSYVIKNCTMKGTSHDQLHLVLVPILDHISELKQAGHSEDKETQLKEIDALLKAYRNHFSL